MDQVALDGSPIAGGVAMSTPLQQNARDLERELAWFARLLDARFQAYFSKDAPAPDLAALAPPDLSGADSPYARFLQHYEPAFEERAALVLSLVPHVRPQLLDVFFTKNQKFDRKFTEFGGLRGGPDGDFVPTGETLAFVLGGNDLAIRFGLQRLFEADHYFARHNILRLTPLGDEPLMKAPLKLSDETLGYFTTGHPRRPDFGANFPARFIETQLTWDDLVLHPGTRRQIEEIGTWIKHGDALLNDWGMAPKLRPGYRALFYGPPGTGKTMTACLLGKSTGRDVYKVDLSLVVSKYIGETEKTWPTSLIRRSTRAGSCSSMKPTPFSGSGARPRTRMIGTPTRKSPSSCSASRRSTVLRSWLLTSGKTSTKRSLAASNRSSIFQCRALRNGCASGSRVSPRKPGWRDRSTSTSLPTSTRSRAD